MNKEEIIELITDNEHEEALQEMLQYATSHTPQYVNEINTHIQNLNNLENDNRIGFISRDEFKRDMTKLTMAMLQLLDKMEKNEPIKNNDMKTKIPSQYTDSLKQNMKSVFSMLDDYNRKLGFTSDPMEREGVKYKIEKCMDTLEFYLKQFVSSTSNLSNDEVIKAAKEIIKEEESKVNIGNINISGGNVQIADTINNHGIDETTIETILKKVLNK